MTRRLTNLGAFRILEEDGLKGLMDLLRREIRGKKASFLVLDGLIALDDVAFGKRRKNGGFRVNQSLSG